MARPLKIFTIQTCDSFLPREALKVLGARPHNIQGDIYVVASTKKDAVERLSAAVSHRIGPASVFLGSGYSVEAVAAATDFLTKEGDLIAMQGNRVAACRNGSWLLVGETSYKDPANSHKHLQKPIFVPVATEQKPVRITIEIDPDMDLELVNRLLVAGARCTIVFGRIDQRTVVGKVVES